MYFVDYTGRRYGKLVVLERGIRNSSRKLYEWICQCDCGNIKSVIGKDLREGNTTSCGCMSSRTSEHNATKTHGISHTPIYNVWCGMKARCNNPHVKSYQDYGAKGTSVCERWLNFENFYEDMGDSYQKRINHRSN